MMSSLADYESNANDTFALRCIFFADRNPPYDFCPNVNINMTISDIRDDVLNEPDMPDHITDIDANNWKVFLVDGEMRLPLDGEQTLKSYRSLKEFGGREYFEFRSDGPTVEDEGVQPSAGPKPDNKKTFKVTVESPCRQKIEFVMDLNISLPVKNIIDNIVQHPDVPPNVKNKMVTWILVINETPVTNDEINLNSIGGHDFYSDDIHLKVVDERNLHQNNNQTTDADLGLRRLRGNNNH